MNAESRILLIDDDRIWAETLADYLRGKGFAVRVTAAAYEGLALLEQDRHIVLAVVDRHLPDMDGLELLRRLRQRHGSPAVLMISGDDDPTLAARAVAEGARGFLAKASPPNLLLRTVCQVLSATRHHLPVPRRAGRTLPVPVSE